MRLLLLPFMVCVLAGASMETLDAGFTAFCEKHFFSGEKNESLWTLEPLTSALYQFVSAKTSLPNDRTVMLKSGAPLGLNRLHELDYKKVLHPNSTGALTVTILKDDTPRYFIRVAGGCLAYQDRLFGPFVYQGDDFVGPAPKTKPVVAQDPRAAQGGQPQLSELSLALLSSDLAKARKIVSEHPEQVNERDKNGMAPLHYAVSARKVEAVKLLVEAGADVNASNLGLTPLMIVTSNGDLELRRYLLDHGAK